VVTAGYLKGLFVANLAAQGMQATCQGKVASVITFCVSRAIH
jgi:hypothetical protein